MSNGRSCAGEALLNLINEFLEPLPLCFLCGLWVNFGHVVKTTPAKRWKSSSLESQPGKRQCRSATKQHDPPPLGYFHLPTFRRNLAPVDEGRPPMRFCLVMLLLLSTEFANSQQQKEEHTFPTKDQIQLVLTQSERAFDVYEQTVKQEAQMGGDWEKAVANDRVVLANARDLIERLKKSPDGFNGPAGFLLGWRFGRRQPQHVVVHGTGWNAIGWTGHVEGLRRRPEVSGSLTGLHGRLYAALHSVGERVQHVRRVPSC